MASTPDLNRKLTDLLRCERTYFALILAFKTDLFFKITPCDPVRCRL